MTGTVTGGTTNNAPVFADATTTRSVPENSAVGTNVGSAVTATDADSDTLEYTLEGTDAASFAIVSTSGQIQTKTGVTYNHEGTSSYSVTVKADDGNGGTDTIGVTITVSDVDEAPSAPGAPDVTAASGTTDSLVVDWKEPANTGPAINDYDVQYRKSSDTAWTAHAHAGTATTTTITGLEASTSYQVHVLAKNAEGTSDWSASGTGSTGTSATGALISNVGQTAATGDAQVSTSQSQAQGFTIGSDSGGYTLGSVELAVSSFSGTASDITVSIYSESSVNPGTVVHTLTTPASISAAVTTFTAPSGATLAAGTTYYVVISTTSSGISLSRTDAAAEDTGGVSGWSIADSRRFLGGSGWNTTTNPIRMRVNGDAATSTNSPATGAPTITGTPAVGELLTADISNIGDADGIADADFEYQWIANDGTTDSDISGATGETYRPLLAHLAQTIKVRVTFDDDDDNAESLTSAATAAVTASTYGQVIWAATLTVEEETVAAGTFFGYAVFTRGSLEPISFTHDGNSTFVSILQYLEGAQLRWEFSGGSLGSADFNLYLDGAPFLIESPGTDTFLTFSDHGLTWTDEQEVEVRLTVNRAATGAPAITGTPEEGETLTASISAIMDEDGVPAAAQFAYQWISNDGTDDSDIDGATDSTYTLVQADEGKSIKVRVSFTDNAKFPESLTSAATAAVTVPVPALVSNVGQTATGNANVTATQSQGQGFTTGSDSGGYTLGSVELAVSSFSGTASDITVSIYSESSDDPGTVVHTLTTPASISMPVTTFTAPSGTTLAAGTTYYVVISTTSSGINLSRTNATAEDTGGASGWSIADDRRLFGGGNWVNTSSPIRMRVNGAAASTDIWSATLTVAEFTIEPNTYRGYTHVGTAVGELDPSTFSHDGDEITVNNLWHIVGGLLTFEISQELGGEGFLLRLGETLLPLGEPTGDPPVYRFSDHGVSWSVGDTVEVRLIPNHAATGAPVITGTARVGETLTAGISGIMDEDGLPVLGELTYQWISDDSDIDGATDSTYTLVQADAGKSIKVRVSFTDGGGFPESLTSAPTAAVLEMGVTVIPADSSLVPDGLGPGDRFRLIFLSSETRTAEATDIATYNTWVQGLAANGHADIQDHSSTFRVVGSTAAVDARDNTSTTYTASDKGVAIYWLGGDKAADDYEDFYDETWDEEASIRDESGTTATPRSVFTGSNHDGTKTGQPLGTNVVTVGVPNSTIANDGPLSSDTSEASTGDNHLYALSGVFQVSLITEVPADWSLAPSGLQEGDQFRLLFISSAHRSASPSEIATYNSWVQDLAANGHTDIQDYSSSFRAVGSTEDMDARDNTGTTYTSSDKGVAIYWLGGNKVADDYADFYDEDWDEEASMKNESGTAETGVSAWTGSDHDGTEMLQGTPETSRALGNSNNAWVRFGKTDSASHGPLSGATAARGGNKRIYGLSGVFEVVAGNNPATGAPTITGTAQVGELLTADISNIGDPDGIADATFSYQWIADDGTDDADISGATGGTYRPLLAHLDQTIKVRVSFTDDEGNPESLTSTATAAVAASTYGQVIWAATLTVGTQGLVSGFWSPFFGSLDPRSFTYDGTEFSVERIRYDGNVMEYRYDDILGPGHFNLYLDGDPLLLTDPGTAFQQEWPYPGLTWTDGQEVEVRLTVNRAPTAGPTITGDVQVGGTLTADPSAIVDPDGIPTGATYTYQWVRVDGMSETNISGATASTYTLVADDGGKTIKVKVSYTDEANFVDTATSNATTKVATAPAPPTGVDITTEGNGELTVGWTAPTENGGSDITGYKVQWKSGAQSFGSSRQHTTADGAATSYTIPSLTNGTEYTVRVLAVNAVGDSAASNTDTGTPSTTPSDPTNVQASGNAELTVTWDAPDDGGSAITGYTVQWKSGTQSYNTSRQATVTTTTHTIPSLTNDTTYTLRVKATNANGDSGWTEITATPVSGPGVASVTVDQATITQTSAAVTVTVANRQDPVHLVYLRYRVEGGSWPAAANLILPSFGTASLIINLTDLTGNTEYEVEASLDSTFASGVKTASFTTSPTKPGQTRGVNVTFKGNGQLAITWTAPSNDGGSAITGYKVQWKSGSQSFGGDPSREHTSGASASTYVITGLSNGTEYTVRVISVNAVGDGPPSTTATGTPVGPPDAPPNVQAGSGHQQLTVSWGAPNDGGSAITEYTLQWKSGSQNFNSTRQRTITGTSRTDTIPSLINGTEYTVRVRATTALGDSDWSAEAKGTPRAGPHVSTIRVKEPISCTVTFVALEFVNLDTATEYQAHLRFRAQGRSSWTVLSPQGFLSSGLSSGAARGELNGPSPAFTLTDLAYETTYEVQAALDSGFVDGLATTTFSTPNLSEVGLTPLSPGDGTLGLRMTRPTSGGRVDGYLLQWKSGDEEYDDTDTSERQADVPGPGDREHTITGLDNGVEYTLRAMAYNDNGVGVPSSEVRGTPEAPPNSPARGAPTISGTAQVGETLTADTEGIEDDDGLDDAVYSYQWLADAADISGATGDTYTPAYDDEGKVISVKVSFIDDRDFEETLTSEPTEEVAEDPDAPTEPPNAPRTVRIVGDTNTSLTLTWDAPDGGTAVTEYRVQWLTVGEGFANARGDGREAVLGAAARDHTITGLSTGEFYQVRVLAVNGAGESVGSNTAWGFPGLGGYGHG